MALITTSVPNLSGGVSQQPTSQRLPHQCQAQENALPLLVGGLVKRPPSIHIGELLDSAGASIDASSYFTHFVTRDSTEEFLMTLTGVGNAVHISDLTGTNKNVGYDLGASTYLTSATPQTSFRAISIADVTFLVNTDVAATMKTDAADLSLYSRNQTSASYEGLIWLKSSGQGVKYSVKVRGAGESEDFPSTVVHHALPDQIGGAGTSSDPNVYGYPPGAPSTSDVAEGLATGADVEDCIVGAGIISVYHDESDQGGNAVTAATVEVQADDFVLTYTTSAGTDTSTIDMTLAANDSLGELVTVINALSKGFVATLIGGGDGQGSIVLPVTASASCLGQFSAKSFGRPGGLNGYTDYTAEAVGSVVYVRNTSEDFQLTVEDSFGQNGHEVIKDSVQNFSDLPPVAKNNFLILVKGDPESDVDDYYVKFSTNGDEDFGEGVWIESIGPGLVYQWDYDTMPHIVIRQSDGTFIIKRADGTTHAGAPADADYSAFKFTPREVGSDLTNPLPSFVTRPITDISFFKNRLAILSGEDCALSETGEFFNFFRTTTTVLLDTAVIDVGVGGTEVNKIEKAVPFSDRLVLFSKRTQFVLQGEAILSPATASITQVTNFDVTTTVRPVLAGNAMFFAFNRGSFSGIREFYKTTETDINFDAVEATAQVPKYIAGEIKEMTASTHEDILVVLASSATTMYVYKYFKTDRGRVQSAWFEFNFSNCEIIDIQFIGQSLYLVVKRGTKTFLERMDLQAGLVDTGKDYVTTVDRRTEITATGSGFTLELPYDIVAGDTMQVVSADGEIMTVDSTATNTVTLNEEFSASDVFYVGIAYTMRYELTEPVLKKSKDQGGFEMVATGRHQLRYMTVVYDNTAYFTVRVTPEIGGSYGTAVDYPFSGRFLSAGGFLGSVPSESGDFRFPVFAQSDAIKIEILNDSPLPSNIQSIEFEANYVSRSATGLGGG